MIPSIHILMQQIRNHPDFVGGTIFTTGDVPEGKQLPPDWREDWLTERLTELGYEILSNLCLEVPSE